MWITAGSVDKVKGVCSFVRKRQIKSQVTGELLGSW